MLPGSRPSESPQHPAAAGARLQVPEPGHGEYSRHGSEAEHDRDVTGDITESVSSKEHPADVVHDVRRRQDLRPDLRPERQHRHWECDPAGQDEHTANELHDRGDLSETKNARPE